MDNIKLNPNELIVKVIGAIIMLMLGIISYFLTSINANIQSIDERTRNLDQQFAVMKATTGLQTEVFEGKLNVLKMQIDAIQKKIDEEKDISKK